MAPVIQEPVPADSLLRTFRQGPDPAAWERYSDCFRTVVDGPVTLPGFVLAFYTSPVFRVERVILARFGWPSTDDDARRVADGTTDRFAAWRVLARAPGQLLLGDMLGNTRSWFAASVLPGDPARTELRFGSGIAARQDPHTGERRPSLGFRLLGGFHVVYSRVLLASAAGRLPGPAGDSARG
ncbi:MAG: hypothetical protein J0M16_00605 [Gammaproteobacteria bacterium]|jgi:hypothetical protein|nr:hypothetical protein [Gammaproteobacteria bacterium]